MTGGTQINGPRGAVRAETREAVRTALVQAGASQEEATRLVQEAATAAELSAALIGWLKRAERRTGE